ncbi:MAG: AAA family ATPase [Bacteroidetes bacterium]|nr:AAA family ATPase [Bacteroidota bacterium]
MGIVYALANQKGGVGKTTTAISLGTALAELGRRVLLVDTDPQANATSAMGLERGGLSLYDALAGEVAADRVTTHTSWPGLDMIPSSVALAGAEVELVAVHRRETVLRRCLEPVRSLYDTILVDCPPSLGLLTLNSLTAADAVIVPVQCEYLALEGLERLMETIRLVQTELNPSLQVIGLLLTMFDARTNLCQQVVDEVDRYYGDLVFQTIVSRSVRLAEAPSYGQSILQYDPASRGAQSYRAVAREVLARESVFLAERR